MNILFVASRFPYPPLQGDRVRAYYQLRHLAQRHAITLVAPAPNAQAGAALAAMQPYCRSIVTVPAPAWQRWGRLLRAPLSPLPWQTLFSFPPALLQQVRSLLRAQPYHLAHVQLIRMAPVAAALDSVPKVIDLIDALSVNMRRRAQRERGPLRWLTRAEAGRVLRYERALTHTFDQLLISSAADRDSIGDYGNLHVAPNGVDTQAYAFGPGERQAGLLVFIGAMKYFPNVDAVTWFVREVFPAVRRALPHARLLIVGANPPAAVRRLAKADGVTVTGFVPSTQTYLSQAAAAVVPMQSGSGMQFKVLEAMACGAPVVATPLGLGGLDAQPDRHLLVAASADEFTRQVVRLLTDPALQRYLAANARQLVEAQYSWTRSVEALERVYALACARPRADPPHTN